MLDLSTIFRLTQETGYGRSSAGTGDLDMSGGQVIGLQESQILKLESQDFAYQPPAGCSTLRSRYAATVRDDVSISEKLIVTVGAKQALFLALAYYSERSRRVFVPSPGWMPYKTLAVALGMEVITYDPHSPATLIDQVSGHGNSLVVLNYPHNPTGCLCCEHQLKRLVDVVIETDSFLVCDEVYRALDPRSASATKYLGSGRVAVVDSVSKWAGAAGSRVGFLCGEEDLIDYSLSVIGNSTSGTSSFAQAWASQLLVSRETIDRASTAAFASLAALETALTTCGYTVAAKGGIYLWVCGGPTYEVADHHLVGARGEAFGAEGFTRLCPLACPNPWNTLSNRQD